MHITCVRCESRLADFTDDTDRNDLGLIYTTTDLENVVYENEIAFCAGCLRRIGKKSQTTNKVVLLWHSMRVNASIRLG